MIRPPLKSILLPVASILFLLVLLAYAQVLNHGFILFDDPGYVTENQYVATGLASPDLCWAFTNTDIGHWHPLTWLSHKMDVSLFGLNPAGHHLTNILLHAFNTILLFLVLHQMTGALWRSVSVAALFAVHPINVESVAWVSERKNVLSTFFWILTLAAYARYVLAPVFSRYAIVFALLLLGLLVKPMLVTLPFALLLLDVWPLGRYQKEGGTERFSRLVVEKLPLFFLSAASTVVTIYAAGSVNTVAGLDAVPLWDRIPNAFIFYVRYLLKLVYPVGLAIVYPYPAAWSMTGFVVSALVVIAVSAAVVLWRRFCPYLFVGWFWFLGTMVPVIGIVQAGSQSIADRYAYVPMIGLLVMAVWGLGDLSRPWSRRGWIRITVMSVVLVSLLVMTMTQVGHWRNSATLFRHAVEIDGGNFLARYLYGKALLEKGELPAAADQFRAAVSAKGDFAEAYHELGLVLLRQKHYEEALPAFQQASRYKPGNGDTRLRIGEIYLELGQKEQAAEIFEKLARDEALPLDLLNRLGLAEVRLGRDDRALRAFDRAVGLRPDHPGVRNNLAMLLLRQGDTEGAIRHFREALRLVPDFANAHYFLGEALRLRGMPKQAALHKKAAIRINPRYERENPDLWSEK